MKRYWDCVFCNKLFPSYAKTARHILTHIGEKSYFCQICDASFVEKWHLNDHLFARHRNFDSIKKKIKNKTQYECSSCGKIFGWKQSLNLHQQRRHGTDEDLKAFKCDLCPAAFASSKYLKRHRKRHDKPELNVTCDLCDEAMLRSVLGSHRLQCHPEDFYRNSRNLVVRRRRKSMSFLCSICDATFRNESELNEHKKNHLEVTTDLDDIDHDENGPDKKTKKKRRKKIKFKCAFCPARFGAMERLEKHFTEVHKGTVAVDDETESLENEGALKSTAEKETRGSNCVRTINSPADIPTAIPTLTLVNHH